MLLHANPISALITVMAMELAPQEFALATITGMEMTAIQLELSLMLARELIL